MIPGYGLTAVTAGYRVYVDDLGATTLVSGFIPELASAEQQAWRKAGPQPNAPEDIGTATLFFYESYQTELELGTPDPEAEAMNDLFHFYRDVANYLTALNWWLMQATTPQVLDVFDRYAGILH